jgi:hypothetical protein
VCVCVCVCVCCGETDRSGTGWMGRGERRSFKLQSRAHLDATSLDPTSGVVAIARSAARAENGEGAARRRAMQTGGV